VTAEPDITAALGGDVVALAPTGDVAAAAREHARPGAVISCLDVLEQLDHFLPVVEALVAAAEAGATVVVRVPNTPLTGQRGASTWGEGALEELRGLLPADAVVLRQVPLRGAAIVREHGVLAVEVDVEDHHAASHFVAAFGPRAAELADAAAVAPADLAAERAEHHRLRSDVAFLEARVRELEARLGPAAGVVGLPA
jgi:hypothetical protein